MRATVIGMDSGIMGMIMIGMVLTGMGLSVIQLIAELVARGRLAAFLAERDEALRELHSQSPPQDAGPQSTGAAAPSSSAAA